LWWP